MTDEEIKIKLGIDAGQASKDMRAWAAMEAANAREVAAKNTAIAKDGISKIQQFEREQSKITTQYKEQLAREEYQVKKNEFEKFQAGVRQRQQQIANEEIAKGNVPESWAKAEKMGVGKGIGGRINLAMPMFISAARDSFASLASGAPITQVIAQQAPQVLQGVSMVLGTAFTTALLLNAKKIGAKLFSDPTKLGSWLSTGLGTAGVAGVGIGSVAIAKSAYDMETATIGLGVSERTMESTFLKQGGRLEKMIARFREMNFVSNQEADRLIGLLEKPTHERVMIVQRAIARFSRELDVFNEKQREAQKAQLKYLQVLDGIKQTKISELPAEKQAEIARGESLDNERAMQALQVRGLAWTKEYIDLKSKQAELAEKIRQLDKQAAEEKSEAEKKSIKVTKEAAEAEKERLKIQSERIAQTNTELVQLGKLLTDPKARAAAQEVAREQATQAGVAADEIKRQRIAELGNFKGQGTAEIWRRQDEIRRLSRMTGMQYVDELQKKSLETLTKLTEAATTGLGLKVQTGK